MASCHDHVLTVRYKQFAAITGDKTFQASRRWLFEQANAHNFTQTWTYQMDARLAPYPPALGAAHSVDVSYVFGDPQLALSNATSERAEWARSFNFTEADAAFSRTMLDYWCVCVTTLRAYHRINFAYFRNPNGDERLRAQSAMPVWPEYGTKKNLLEMTLDSLDVVPDTFREEQIRWFLDRPKDFNY